MKTIGENGAETRPNGKQKVSKNRMRFRLLIAAIVLLVSFSSLVAVTFAWYIYQTGAKTSNIRMAVGAGSTLQISNQYDGEYGSSALMDEFHGALHPVSTDRILGGFQKVTAFTQDVQMKERRAILFGDVETNDYYKTTLYVRVGGNKQMIYLSNIGFEDDDPDNPISTAIRIGFVIHEPGKDKPPVKEYVFAINEGDNPQALYNTATGQEGYVLDSSKTDGTTIPMEHLYTAANFCQYDSNTGITTVTDQSLAMFELTGSADGGYGLPVQVDVYVWLEGCDKDCYNNLVGKMLNKIALSFAGKTTEE